MKKLTILAVAIGATFTASAQTKEYPIPPKMSAPMTEFWTPQPKIITTDDFDNKMVTAPSDAIVLYDGSNTSEWVDSKGEAIKWVSEDGVLTVKPGTGVIKSVRKFEDCQLHIEWSSPTEVKGTSQGRGNSGVFLQGIYEVQILDNYDNETYINGQAGSIYKQSAPLVNPTKKPGKWNVYDIIYKAPIFKNGKMAIKPTITVLFNGVVVQDHTTILGSTEYVGHPQIKEHGAESIVLQDHSNPVRFRNIWIREL